MADEFSLEHQCIMAKVLGLVGAVIFNFFEYTLKEVSNYLLQIQIDNRLLKSVLRLGATNSNIIIEIRI